MAIRQAKDTSEKEKRCLGDPKTRGSFVAARKANAADECFCCE
jgi:hypothetical protein